MRYFLFMQTVTEIIVEQGMANKILSAAQLDRMIDGSPRRRYGLVNRALNKGELLRLQRGLYVLADRYRDHPCHPFVLAQALAPGSYVSFETALYYHGWIPERVFETASVIPGRKSKRYSNEKCGVYRFHPLAIQSGFFLELVDRIEVEGQQSLIAKPCRALLDLVCLRKISWSGVGWFTEGLRIDHDVLRSIVRSDMNTLVSVYKHKRLKSFITSFCKELAIDFHNS